MRSIVESLQEKRRRAFQVYSDTSGMRRRDTLPAHICTATAKNSATPEKTFVLLVREYCAYRFARKDKNVYRFKGFDSSHCGDSMNALEQIVNVWMEAEHPRIRHVCQSMRGDHILLSFVYEETRELEQRVAAQTQVSLPRYFEDDFVDDRPTGGRIPATPPPMH